MVINENGDFNIKRCNKIIKNGATEIRTSGRPMPTWAKTYSVNDRFFKQFENTTRLGANAKQVNAYRLIEEREADFLDFKTKLMALKKQINENRRLTLCSYRQKRLEGGKILNPATNRYVKASGKIGKSILSCKRA